MFLSYTSNVYLLTLEHKNVIFNLNLRLIYMNATETIFLFYQYDFFTEFIYNRENPLNYC